MSYISESKTVTINVNFKGQIIEGIHTISYYDSPSIDVAEMDYDVIEYTPQLSDDDTDELSDLISDYISEKCSRGLGDVVDGEVINLNVVGGVLK